MAGTDAMRDAAREGALRLERPDPATLALVGVLTFATAARAYADCGRALAEGGQVRLDLGGLGRVDSAGLACVLALAAAASRAGRPLQVLNWPEGLRSLAAACDVTGLLGHAPRPG